MWLINCHSLVLEFHHDPSKVKYAILSHTWGDGEVTFKDMAKLEGARPLKGFEKIRGTCEMAIKDGFKYAWVDTCCIDKTSSAELSEAINSMFGWYQQSDVCYVYLSDVSSKSNNAWMHPHDKFHYSRWFTRGWTLQELIAPTDVQLYDAHWNLIARLRDNEKAVDTIVSRTGIPRTVLVREAPRCPGTAYTTGPLGYIVPAYNECRGDKIAGMCNYCQRQRSSIAFLEQYCIAERMSWAAGRHTTRPEDRAYSLLGIFGVNMPLLYGESNRAFARLHQEIIRTTDDQSILAHSSGGSLFADSPDSFQHFGFVKLDESILWLSSERNATEMKTSSKSVEMSMLLCPLRHADQEVASELYLGILACSDRRDRLSRPAVLLQQSRLNQKCFHRHPGGYLLEISALSQRSSIKSYYTYADYPYKLAPSHDISAWFKSCRYNLKDVYFEENVRLLPTTNYDSPYEEITSVTTPPLKITVVHQGVSYRGDTSIHTYPHRGMWLGRRQVKSRQTFRVTDDDSHDGESTSGEYCDCYYLRLESFTASLSGMQALDKANRFGIVSLDRRGAPRLFVVWGWDRGQQDRSSKPIWCHIVQDNDIPDIEPDLRLEPGIQDFEQLERRAYSHIQKILQDLNLNADSKHTIQRVLEAQGRRQTVEASIWQTTVMQLPVLQLDIDIDES